MADIYKVSLYGQRDKIGFVPVLSIFGNSVIPFCLVAGPITGVNIFIYKVFFLNNFKKKYLSCSGRCPSAELVRNVDK